MKRVYVFDCGDFVKIGVSDNPENRRKQIPYHIAQYYATRPLENAFEIEGKMHKSFSKSRVPDANGTEYFNVSFDYATKKLMDLTGTKQPHKRTAKDSCFVFFKEDEIVNTMVAKKLIEALPYMDDFDKGYIAGTCCRTLEDVKKREERENEKVTEKA